MKILAVAAIFCAVALRLVIAQEQTKLSQDSIPAHAWALNPPTTITDSDEQMTVLQLYREFAGLQEKEKAASDSVSATELGKKRANLMRQIDEVQANINRLNAQISQTQAGKELGEIQLQEQNFGKKFNEAVAPIMKAHNCAGGQIMPSLSLKNCDKPAQ